MDTHMQLNKKFSEELNLIEVHIGLLFMEVSKYLCQRWDCDTSLLSRTVNSSQAISTVWPSVVDYPDMKALPEEMRRVNSFQDNAKKDSLLCSKLTTFPGWISRLTLLAELRIHSCPQLISSLDEMDSLSTLQRLTIWDRSSLTTLLDCIGSLTSAVLV
ncbi:hypothetical protein CK203_035025 [Vitis vinifera]|uniref:Uncharacterized protein n=1 Tax=Vitis vinifera TaxID=29760 RepID=A0A438I9V5_VITVI|nr:hypothetical protein CK203_035025 [Vitis vinifera]